MDEDNDLAWMYSEDYREVEGDTTPLSPLVVTLPLAAADAAGFVAQRQQQTEEDRRGSYDPLFNGNGSSDEEEGEGGERGTATPATLATAGRGSMAAATTTTEAMDESVDDEDTEEEEEEEELDVSDDDGEEEDDGDGAAQGELVIEGLLRHLHAAAERGVCSCAPSCR